jgi:myo-inositol-1(or 4)-monophosphatase
VTDWLSLCRHAAGDVRLALAEIPTREGRERVLGRGEGGDDTVAIDQAAEEAVLRRLESLHASGIDFVLISEELGERSFGDAPTMRIVVDPIDGSVNAKRSIPFYSLSIAIADGPTMGDVTCAYVYDFGSGEEWTALRGEGAFLDGRPLAGQGPKDMIELLSFEATMTHFVASKSAAFVGLAERIRVMGSLALSLCHLAAGRVDGVVSLRPIRSVDVAAAQLLVREQGLSIELPEAPPFLQAPLDLGMRSRVAAAGTAALVSRLAEALDA